MIRHIPAFASDIARWVRETATSVNSLIALVESPQVNQVRYNPATPGLEYYDGSAWQPVP